MRSTKPLFVSGVMVNGLRIRFEGGRAVEIEAEQGGDTLRALAQRDAGASRLGEVALVDGESRIGGLDKVFFDTLLDENAASHIALGEGLDFTVGRGRSAGDQPLELHIDFMIGSRPGRGDRHRARWRRGAAVERWRLAGPRGRSGRAHASPAALALPLRARHGEVPERLNGRDWKSRNGG